MKALNFFGHPIFLSISFLLLLISGEAFGGPYLLYLILGTSHGAFYSLTGLAGILFTVASLKASKDGVTTILVLVGVLLMTVSLYLFFTGERLHYNRASFEQTLPVLSFGLFALSVLCTLIKTVFAAVRLYFRYRRRSSSLNSLG
ncbi:MAG: hypothetical protein JWP69_1654 [Flaviaesturariibacter sp.]|nr:hypothetical protein [Flaviaesturariibacter sp.]